MYFVAAQTKSNCNNVHNTLQSSRESGVFPRGIAARTRRATTRNYEALRAKAPRRSAQVAGV